MRGRIGAGAALAVGAVLLASGCGQRNVTFQPVDGTGSGTQPSVTATAAVPVTAPPDGVTTDAAAGVVITRNGSTVCVRGPRGGTACTSGHGTVVVDGVTVKDGVVVSGNGAAVSTVTSRRTTGRVSLSGAVTGSGTATGTCEGHGTGVRTIVADLPGRGRLTVHNVGDGVLRVTLVADGTSYALSRVGGGGPVSSTDSRTVIKDARLGRGGSQVVLDADFDC